MCVYVCLCLLCTFITLMAVSFLSLPLSLLPMLPWRTLGALTSQASLSQSWIFAVASFVCVFFFFLLFTCLSLSVSLSVTHAPSQIEGPQSCLAKGSPGIQQHSCP